MAKSGIYKMYWENNDYFYYGQSVNISYRKSSHKNSLLKGIHKNRKVQSVFNKYGLPIFDIVELCTIDMLDEREQLYLDAHHSDKNCCNINKLATSSKGIKQTLESIEKNRISHLLIFDGDKNPFFGKKHSDETKALLSLMKKGKPIPQFINRIPTKVTQETRDKLSAIRKYGGAPKAKIVLDVNSGVFYSCAKEVSDLYNIPHSTLRARLNGSFINNTKWIYA